MKTPPRPLRPRRARMALALVALMLAGFVPALLAQSSEPPNPPLAPTQPGVGPGVEDAVWSFAVGSLLPALIAVINRPYWSSHTKTCVSLLCTMFCAMGLVWLSGKWDVNNIGATVISVLLFSDLAYRRYKGLGWKASIENTINPGTPPDQPAPSAPREEG